MATVGVMQASERCHACIRLRMRSMAWYKAKFAIQTTGKYAEITKQSVIGLPPSHMLTDNSLLI
jgi:hypothetical protein